LSDDERALWTGITRSIKPIRPLHMASNENIPPVPILAPSPAAPARPVSRQPHKPASNAALAPIERRFKQRLARGIEPIDARLDLHGFTQQQAHHALVHFLHQAHADGARTTLIVTGKGNRRDEADLFAERGVLRRVVPQWLRASELRVFVLGFEVAAIPHGGEGALYVRLRRKR
jgi:DNA-nicking Smr family endonuclease